MKTIYLHIGIGKTGTLSIQNFLAANYELLLSAGINYLGTGRMHHNFAKSFITNIPHYMEAPANIETTHESILNAISQCDEDVILISSENFPSADPCLVRSFFNEVRGIYNFKIILFVRTQDELIESEYNQLVKVRAEKRTLSEYSDSDFYGDFMKLASDWEQVFGRDNLICRIYNGANFNALTDFLNCLSIPINIDIYDSGKSAPVTNSSLGFAALTTKRLLNILQPPQEKLLFRPPADLDLLFRDIDVPAILMSSIDARNFRERYYESNRKFTERYLGQSKPDLGGRKYSDSERDHYYQMCKNLINFC